MPNSCRYSVRARWVLFPGRPPLPSGVVTVAGGRIESLEPGPRAAVAYDLGDAVLFPGLVNPHTHLEFSSLPQPLSGSGSGFPGWIREVVRYRRAAASPVQAAKISREAAIRQGWSELAEQGVWTAGEITTPPPELAPYQDAGFAGVLYHERLGLADSQWTTTLTDLQAFLADAPRQAAIRHGISPHAPYSVHWQLFCGLVQLAVDQQLPIAMHLAESRDEIEFLRTRHGRFREVLEELEVWNSAAWPVSLGVQDYLERLATAPRTLLVHGNYLSNSELDFLARHRSRFAICYCPRTHAYFGHDPYPLREIVRRELRLVVGTDSRGSNPDLCLGREVQQVAAQFPGFAPERLLRSVTTTARWALGLGSDPDMVSRGEPAEFSWFSIPPGDIGRDPWELFLSEVHRSRCWLPAPLSE